MVRVAIDAPLDRFFDYLPRHAGAGQAQHPVGCRVLVPFGARKVVGIVVEHAATTDVPRDKLRHVHSSLDSEPLLGPAELELGRWLGSYYHHPRGAALFSLLPSALRKPVVARAWTQRHWQVSAQGLGLPADALRRAPKQAALLQMLAASPEQQFDDQQLADHDISTQVALELEKKGLARRGEHEALPESCNSIIAGQSLATAPIPNAEQRAAIDTISGMLGDFGVLLLEGVTGSGKTEVYLSAIEKALARGQQALVLVPEIGLTPQTIARFSNRFAARIAVFHSGLNDRERLAAWLAASRGEVDIIIGTRSAVFTRCPRLGLLIVDEEHDPSYKQQDGLHYNARDIAVLRGRAENACVVLGSATPSLETLHNALGDRYRYALLQRRAGGASPPAIEFVDIRRQALHEGLSDAAIAALADTLAGGRQAMAFINRRGYAPLLMCHDCGWSANCDNCDARMTLHRAAGELRCHHCERRSALPAQCPRCQSRQLQQLGQGTQRISAALESLFPGTPVLRIDSDAIRGRQALAANIEQINRGEALLLVGTQMLAKGHDFSALDTVVILDADQGLYSPDFRAEVKTLQLLEQVAGRAGRSGGAGRVLVQTHLPDHPLLLSWRESGYLGVRESLLQERQQRALPPFSHMALLRADSRQPRSALDFLRRLNQRLRGEIANWPKGESLHCGQPTAALMEKRAGRHRAQMVLQAGQRAALHRLLDRASELIAEASPGQDMRLSIDVDPQESL